MKYDMIKPNQPHLREPTVKRWTRPLQLHGPELEKQIWPSQTPWSQKYRYRKLVTLQRPAPCIDTLYFLFPAVEANHAAESSKGRWQIGTMTLTQCLSMQGV